MNIRNTLLASPLRFGTAPLGNMYRKISDEEATATVDAAWARRADATDDEVAQSVAEMTRRLSLPD